jgi:peptidyl-prolyl cis-trans isomerase A (cyclophilin A)
VLLAAPARADEPPAPPEATVPTGLRPALLDPSLATAVAPVRYLVRFHTTAGDFDVEVTRSWSPNGADRLYNLVQIGHFDGVAFYRVVENFVAQFGIHDNPKVTARWERAYIPDDPTLQSNAAGRVAFASHGPNTRSNQLFINLADNPFLDRMGFPPVGEVVAGMDTVRALYSGYGECEPMGRGPYQRRLATEGAAWLNAAFPELDQVITASIVGTFDTERPRILPPAPPEPPAPPDPPRRPRRKR